MRRKLSSLPIFLMSLLLLLGLALVLGAPAVAQERGQVISSESDPTYKAVQRVWTLERMRNAKPYPLPTLEGSPAAAKSVAPAQPTGVPGLIPGGAPGQEYNLQEVLDSIKTFPLGYPYPPPYTRYENFHGTGSGTYVGYKVFPYRAVGVLFFTQNGIDYRCSASSIGNYAIWTAGHCVSDGAGTWSTNFLFMPAYKNGAPAAPVAQWTGTKAWVFTDWHLYGDLCRDSGGVVLNRNSKGWKVSKVGWLGFAWNQFRDQHWHGIGYPSAAPFDGNRMIICASSHSVDDNPCVYADNPLTVGTGCDQTPGCSGGPWIMDFSGGSGATNYLNGNFSYHYVGYLQEKFGPYFDDLSYGLYDTLINDTP